MDWFAISSYGCYPAPAATAAQRAAYAVSFGLLGIVPEVTVVLYRTTGLIKKFAKFIWMRRVPA